MKYLLVIAVVAIVLWLMFGRGRRVEGGKRGARKDPRAPVKMVTCVHCGVHLPGDEAVADPAGRLFCSEAHRLAGPR